LAHSSVKHDNHQGNISQESLVCNERALSTGLRKSPMSMSRDVAPLHDVKRSDRRMSISIRGSETVALIGAALRRATAQTQRRRPGDRQSFILVRAIDLVFMIQFR
jgi:hypothetical protein